MKNIPELNDMLERTVRAIKRLPEIKDSRKRASRKAALYKRKRKLLDRINGLDPVYLARGVKPGALTKNEKLVVGKTRALCEARRLAVRLAGELEDRPGRLKRTQKNGFEDGGTGI